jgi:hypothetical protein
VSAVVDGVDRNEALKTWTPQTRSFSLRIVLALPQAADPDRSAQIRAATTAAIGAAPGADTIDFLVSPTAGSAVHGPLPLAAHAPAAVAEPAPEQRQAERWTTEAASFLATTPLFVLIAAPIAAMTALGGAVFMLLRLERARRLSDRERERLARKFKTLLEGGVSVSQQG